MSCKTRNAATTFFSTLSLAENRWRAHVIQNSCGVSCGCACLLPCVPVRPRPTSYSCNRLVCVAVSVLAADGSTDVRYGCLAAMQTPPASKEELMRDCRISSAAVAAARMMVRPFSISASTCFDLHRRLIYRPRNVVVRQPWMLVDSPSDRVCRQRRYRLCGHVRSRGTRGMPGPRWATESDSRHAHFFPASKYRVGGLTWVKTGNSNSEKCQAATKGGWDLCCTLQTPDINIASALERTSMCAGQRGNVAVSTAAPSRIALWKAPLA